jgi:hypothetical protein
VKRTGGSSAEASIRRYHPDYEKQLFFGKIRRRTKWVFALLAVVFAASFVFLGVGSGGGALSDLWNGRFGDLFGGSSGPTVDGLIKKVQKDPRNASLRLQLAQLTSNPQKPSPADTQIAAWQTYVQLKPKNTTGLQGLAGAYAAKVTELKNLVSSPATPALSALANYQLAPSNTKLGSGLEALPSSLYGVTSLQQGDTALAQKQLASEIVNHMAVYRRIWSLTPNDSLAFLQIGQAAESDGDTAAAIKSYQEFLKRFPADPQAPAVKSKITQLQTTPPSSTQPGGATTPGIPTPTG